MPGLVSEISAGLRTVFKSERGEPVIFPGSGTGAWEASLVNTLSPGERVLTFENGHFAHLWAEAARQLGMQVDEVKLRWGDAVTQQDVEANLKPEHRAVLIVHNETSTGVTTDVGAVRRGIDRTGHDPLLLVDVVSALGSIDFRMDEWRVDVAATGTQKGLMLPPGSGILCVGPRALEASEKSRTPKYFYDWRPVIRDMQQGFFPYTPATLLLFGLREALRMLHEEGLDNVLARHKRLAEGTRAAVRAWGLPLLASDAARASNSLTAVVVDQVDSNKIVKVAAERLNLALGVGLGQLRGRVFRIGHLGSLNELEVLATLAGTELALKYSGQQIELGAGVAAAQRYFAECV
jgi:alanine-glyoxylate transaminase/serine-glyoxylate transaminase/serine-pyruvate transaminase